MSTSSSFRCELPGAGCSAARGTNAAAGAALLVTRFEKAGFRGEERLGARRLTSRYTLEHFVQNTGRRVGGVGSGLLGGNGAERHSGTLGIHATKAREHVACRPRFARICLCGGAQVSSLLLASSADSCASRRSRGRHAGCSVGVLCCCASLLPPSVLSSPRRA